MQDYRHRKPRAWHTHIRGDFFCFTIQRDVNSQWLADNWWLQFSLMQTVHSLRLLFIIRWYAGWVDYCCSLFILFIHKCGKWSWLQEFDRYQFSCANTFPSFYAEKKTKHGSQMLHVLLRNSNSWRSINQYILLFICDHVIIFHFDSNWKNEKHENYTEIESSAL